MRKRGADRRSFITNSRNLLIALLILGAAMAVYSQAQGAVVSHTPSAITPQGAGSGLDADTLQTLSSAEILATSVVETTKPTCGASNKGKMVFVNSEDLLYVCSAIGWQVMQAGQTEGEVSVQATRPSCNVNNVGQIVFVTAVDSAYFCSGGGWKSLEPTTDPDPDGDNVKSKAFGGTDCNDADGTRWQLLTGYPDYDKDGYTLTGVQVCSGASLPSTHLSSASSPVDCDDIDNTKYPGNHMPPMDQKDNKDNNCNGVVDEQYVLLPDGKLTTLGGYSNYLAGYPSGQAIVTVPNYNAVFSKPSKYMLCELEDGRNMWDYYPLGISVQDYFGVLKQYAAGDAVAGWCKDNNYVYSDKVKRGAVYSDRGNYVTNTWPDGYFTKNAYWDVFKKEWFCGPGASQNPISAGCVRYYYP